MGAEVSQVGQVGQVVGTGPQKQFTQSTCHNQHERFSDEKFEEGRGGNTFRYQNRGGVARGRGGYKSNKDGPRDPNSAVSEWSDKGGQQRDPSPAVNEWSDKGGQQRGPKSQPRNNEFQRNNSGGGGNQPPKYRYHEAFKQKGADNKESFQKNLKGQNDRGPQQKNNPNTPAPSNSNLGNTKTVDALNDLLKKEFGSLGGPIHNLPKVEMNEKPFSGRNRLYIGNLPAGLSREEVNSLMASYGDVTVDYYNPEKKFGFIRLKHREQAKNAQRNLDGFVFKGRSIKVRLASSTARFKVLNLTPWVTNELLKKAFSAFGEVERAEIIVEDGKPIGEGFLEFSDKRAGQAALEACVEHCFLLTNSLRPVMLEEMDPDNGLRGFSERQLTKNHLDCKKAREVGPRFLSEGSSEYVCAILWKNFVERKRQEEEELEEKFRLEEEQLEARIKSIVKAEKDLFKK